MIVPWTPAGFLSVVGAGATVTEPRPKKNPVELSNRYVTVKPFLSFRHKSPWRRSVADWPGVGTPPPQGSLRHPRRLN